MAFQRKPRTARCNVPTVRATEFDTICSCSPIGALEAEFGGAVSLRSRMRRGGSSFKEGKTARYRV